MNISIEVTTEVQDNTRPARHYVLFKAAGMRIAASSVSELRQSIVGEVNCAGCHYHGQWRGAHICRKIGEYPKVGRSIGFDDTSGQHMFDEVICSAQIEGINGFSESFPREDANCYKYLQGANGGGQQLMVEIPDLQPKP